MTTKTIFIVVLYFLCNAPLFSQDALTADITNPTYNQSCKNGDIDLAINTGFPPYDVTWKRITFNGAVVVQTNSNIQGNNDGEDLQNVFAATYEVEVEDALCGIARQSFKIKCECSYDCTIEGQVTHPTCAKEGSILTSVNCEQSGHQPFSYKWSDGANTKDRINLASGIYCLTVSDKNNCKFQNCFTIEMGNELQVVVADKQNVSNCSTGPNGNNCTGMINIETPNGNPPYQYKWSNGANTPDLNNLCQGNYYLTVTDAFNCKKTMQVEICCCATSGSSGLENCYGNQSNPLPLSIQGTPKGFPNPNIIIEEISGGTGNYACSWTGPNGYTAYSCMGIGDMTEEGIYCITVDDGCQETSKCFEIVDCDKFNMNVTANILHTCDELTVGEVSLTITGGTPPYQVSWNNSQYTGQTIKKLAAGNYCAYVRDKNGCIQGPFCFSVGSQPGEVSTSTIPCAKTIICNGQAYNNYFDYQVSLDCNTRYSYCPVTQETVVDELGWANFYYEFCNLWGVCQDGQTQLLEVGQQVFEKRLVDDENCEYNLACVNSFCVINNIVVINNTIPRYCALVSNFYGHSSCGENCRAEVSCQGDFMGYVCADFSCNIAANDHDESHPIDTDEITYAKASQILTADEFIAQIKTGKIKLPLQQSQLKLSTKIQPELINIYPNPTEGIINIELTVAQQKQVNYSIFNLLGEKLRTENLALTSGKNKFTLDVSSYTTGVYFIQLNSNDTKSQTFKFIKNN
ncbi:MAG: T9SS type A sorting domain-containing protein [Saprospiraceae bacterium]